MNLPNLARIREEIQCPLCQKVIKETRISVRCLHRFCKTCIEQWIRATGSLNRYCPICHVSFQSKRDFKEDKRFDKFLEILESAFPLEFAQLDVISLEDDLVQSQMDSRPAAAQQVDDLPGSHQRSEKGPSKTDGISRPKRKNNVYKTEEQRKRRTDPMMIGYGTSMNVIIKPMSEQDHIQSDESLNFQLQKDTKLVTLRELVRAHMAETTEDEGYRTGRVKFYTGSTDHPELIEDFTRTIGSFSTYLHDSINTMTFRFTITPEAR